MRSAVLRPTPGIRVSRAASPCCTARTKSAGSMPGEHRQRQLRTDAVDADQALEELMLERGREAEERDLVLAHVRVNAQRDFAAGVAGFVERRHRHLHVVAHAMHVHDEPARVLLDQAAAQLGNHFSVTSDQRPATSVRDVGGAAEAAPSWGPGQLLRPEARLRAGSRIRICICASSAARVAPEPAAAGDAVRHAAPCR